MFSDYHQNLHHLVADGREDQSPRCPLDRRTLGRRVYTYDSTGRKVVRMDSYDANGNLITPQKKQGPGKPDKKK